METSGGIRASLAGRYASALFDLARDQRQIESVGKSLDALSGALVDSKDLSELVESPVVSRQEAGKAFAALAPQFNLDPITKNFIGVLARNGRKVNAKSIMGVMMLAAGKGSRITLETQGPDESEAMDAIIALIGEYFGEGQ